MNERDALLTMVVRTCEQKNISTVTSAFPTLEHLGEMMKLFLNWQAKKPIPWVHLPTFQASQIPIVLLAGCIAAGAVLSSNRVVQRFGLALQELLIVSIHKEVPPHTV